jgi:hypothetical protein
VIDQRDPLELSDNYFDLTAGERRRVSVRWLADGRAPALVARAWNAPSVKIAIPRVSGF